MNKIPKYVVIIACILVMVVLLPLGYVRYKTRYEAEQISVSTSPDGDYELVIYSVGDPDFPFGAAHGRLVLKAVRLLVNAYDTIISVLNIWVESLGISNFIKRTCKWIRLPGTYSMLMRKILYWPLRWNRELLMCLR